MKSLLLVLLQSFVLTVFITLMSQAYMRKTTTANCHGGVFNMKKCASSAEAMSGSLR
ncbi:MAG: hypothetical protein JSU04_16345 [Bdellovibrionales bacterium]|nr:hypothetical protein [Bdellovibrionales bacterium]